MEGPEGYMDDIIQAKSSTYIKKTLFENLRWAMEIIWNTNKHKKRDSLDRFKNNFNPILMVVCLNSDKMCFFKNHWVYHLF